jgi:septum site-determining protein MinC
LNSHRKATTSNDNSVAFGSRLRIEKFLETISASAMANSKQLDLNGRSRQATIAPFQVRGRFLTAIVLQIARRPDAEFFKALEATLARAPHLFSNAPFVLDLDQAVSIAPSFDFNRLVRELRSRNVALIGVQNGTIEQNRAALGAGLITLQGGSDLPAPGKKRNGAASAAEEEAASRALLVTEPVRSGQRIFSDKGDLVVVGSVSSGAELIARGNIHVYGRMRGRALAGVNGDSKARIFCQSLEAELIAIAGLYKTSDEIPPSLRSQCVQAVLEENALRIERLK